MSSEESQPTDSNKSFDAELRKDIVKLSAMFLPTLLIGVIGNSLRETIFNHPERALAIILAAIAVLILILVSATTRKKLVLGWPFLVFLSLYILTFSFAADTSVLDWKRTLVGYGDHALPRDFLALNSYGDWHYSVMARAERREDLVIILMKPVGTLSDDPSNPGSQPDPDGRPDPQGRADLADLLAIAKNFKAKGVAIDSSFVKSRNVKSDEDAGIDDFLCVRIQEAKKAGLKVFVAYEFNRAGDSINPVPMDPNLEPCLDESDQGHMVGYAEHDGLIRSIPLYFRNDRAHEALSLKIAESLSPSVRLPSNGLLQFVPPKNEFPSANLEDLIKPDADKEREILTGRFILVGENSEQDSFETPFGRKPGVMIHAYAVQSLLQPRVIERSWSLSLFPIAIWCYLLMVLTARGVPNLKLILINVAVSLFIVGIAALAMRLWLIWIDLIYPLLAAWLFLLLLIALRRIRRIRTSAVAD